jgi:Ni/Co efflux regulator RcnB
LLVFAALGLAASPAAWAQQDHPDDHRPAEQRPAEQHPEAHPGPVPARPPEQKNVVRHDETVRTHETVVNRNTTVVENHGGGRWHNGDRFTGNRVAFSDWGRYRLEAPQPGYEWVQDGNELLLINLNTGLVTNIFLIP